MWIVRLALRRPYTFVVAALLLLLITPFVLIKTPTDIFPAINIPVVSVIWSYTGLPSDQIAQRIVYEALWVTPIAEAEYVPWLSNSCIGLAQGVVKPTPQFRGFCTHLPIASGSLS
jgi:Cu/Ag efflux pump CusA